MDLRRVVFVAGTLIVAACSGNGGGVAGPAQEDIDDEVPYGQGVVVGEKYEYVLYVHCGVRLARIDGVWWETALLADGNANPPDGWGNPYDDGELTVVDASTAEYTGGPDVTVRFDRTDAIDPPLACE